MSKTIPAPGGSTGEGNIGFNTPGRSGMKGGKTPSREEQPKTTMEALADAPAALMRGQTSPNPKTSPGDSGRGGADGDGGSTEFRVPRNSSDR